VLHRLYPPPLVGGELSLLQPKRLKNNLTSARQQHPPPSTAEGHPLARVLGEVLLDHRAALRLMRGRGQVNASKAPPPPNPLVGIEGEEIRPLTEGGGVK
jgi:hypothetical protein